MRTNNAVEGFNRKLKDNMTCNPTPITFMRTMKKLVGQIWADYQAEVYHGSLSRQEINEALEDLTAGRDTAEDFLQRVTTM